MKANAVASSIVGLICFAGLFATQAVASGEDEAALRQIKEVDWPKAYREQDAALLDRILADEFQMVDGEGRWSTKQEELDYVRKHKPAYDNLRFVIKRLEVFENAMAIVAGAGFITGADDRGRYAIEYQSTNVLIKRGGRWQAIASHVSGAEEKRL